MRIGQPEWRWTLVLDAGSEKEIAHAVVTGDAALSDAHADTGSLASAIGSLVWVACPSGHVNARLILGEIMAQSI